MRSNMSRGRFVLAFFLLVMLGVALVTQSAQPLSAPLYLKKWGELGGGPGQFSGPEGVATAVDGRVYVADTYNHRVQVFDVNGRFLFSWGSLCSLETPKDCDDPDGSGPLQVGDGQFKTIEGIAIDPVTDRVYIADSENQRVQVFTLEGKFLFKWGRFGSVDGQFYLPVGLAVDSLGYVYVADVLNHRVQVFDTAGTYVRQWGHEGTGPGEFKYPAGVAVHGLDVYVTDNGNHRVEHFDRTGDFLGAWGSECNISTKEGCVDPDGAGPLEIGDGQFRLPFGIATDLDGKIYVMDQANNRAEILSPEGKFLTKWGTKCSVVAGANTIDQVDCKDLDNNGPLDLGDGQFNSPKGISVSVDGKIYVADSDNHRIEVFKR